MHPWFKFAGICSIVMAIVIFCVIFGGYSSLWRSKNRIKASQNLMTDACLKRHALLPGLDAFTTSAEFSQASAQLKSAAEKADLILKQMISEEPPVEKELISAFETSQTALSSNLVELFASLEAKLPEAEMEKFSVLKKEFISIQDHIFVAKKRFNREAAYFNNRSNVFPGFLIARLFGMDHLVYIGISNDKLLSGEKTFTAAAS